MEHREHEDKQPKLGLKQEVDNMDEYTWEFDGRCPKCGSEEIIGDEDIGYECECGYKFIVVVDLDEAILY